MLGLGWVLLPALAQDTTGVGSLTGTVVEEGGAGVAQARVCLPAISRCATADAQGAYRLTEIRSGEYDVEITAPGRPVMRQKGMVVRAGLEAMVDLALPNSKAAARK